MYTYCLHHSGRSFAERLVAFAAVEGIFFSGRCAVVCKQLCIVQVGWCYKGDMHSNTQLLRNILVAQAWHDAWSYLLQ